VSTACRFASLTDGESRRTSETSDLETPARAAMSMMVGCASVFSEAIRIGSY
jgi:hypothetical protein